MSLATERKLVSNNYMPLDDSSSIMNYVKKRDETTQYSIKRQGRKYRVTFPLASSNKSYATDFDNIETAKEYLYDIVTEVVV